MNWLFEQFVEWLVAEVVSTPDVAIQTQKRNSSSIRVNGNHGS
ncbi:hypothetical protein LQ419_04735 [Gordonia paraffinivorans]|nr:hypothetical protein [Gordonia paraffinivorans]